MIKIIEKHEYPIPEYRFTCERCGSIADITSDEVRYKSVDYRYEFECPICNIRYQDRSYLDVLNKSVFKKLGD